MRLAMCTAICLTVTLGPGVAPLWGQHHPAPMPTPGFYNGLTPNSTIDGDASRLAGYAGLVNADAARIAAMGKYNLDRAHADAIDSATLMSWNEYFVACIEEENRRSKLAQSVRRQRLIRAYNARQERIANDPDEIDLLNGDALNQLLATALQDPSVRPEEMRRDDPWRDDPALCFSVRVPWADDLARPIDHPRWLAVVAPGELLRP